MSVLDPLPNDLAHAAEALVSRDNRRRRRNKTALIAVGMTLAFGGVGATASTLWRPLLGDDRRGRPEASVSSPPREQLDRFAVLRRQPTPADRGPISKAALALLSPRNVEGVRTAFVRVVPDGDQAAVVIVPAVAAGGKADVLCLFVGDAGDGGGLGCFDLTDIRDRRAVVQMGDAPRLLAAPSKDSGKRSVLVPISPDDAFLTTYGVVPDGVERVRQGEREVAVKDNVFRIRSEESLAVKQPIAWLDGRGDSIDP